MSGSLYYNEIVILVRNLGLILLMIYCDYGSLKIKSYITYST